MQEIYRGIEKQSKMTVLEKAKFNDVSKEMEEVATQENIDAGSATGFHFMQPTPDSFIEAIERLLSLYQDKKVWNRLVKTAMSQDFSWEHSSEEYIYLYNELA